MAQLKSGSTAGGNVILTAAAGSVDNAHISGMAASKLTGALPAIDGSALTGNVRSGRKNLIINGGFDVWQRGTSFSGSSEYSSDRWKTQTSGNVGTTTRTTDAPDTSRYATKVAITGTAAFMQLGQQTEFANFHSMRGKTVTLSFWAKGVGITSLNSRMRQGTTTEDEVAVFGAPTLSVQTKTINTTWQKFTHTFTIGANATAISTDFSAAPLVSGNEIYIAQVQLELGSVATDFEHRSYGEELALCQRYFEKSYNSTAVPGIASIQPGWASTFNNASSSAQAPGPTFKVTKRNNPTIVTYNAVTGASGKAYRVSDAGNKTITVSHVGQSAIGYINVPSSNGYYYHYTADSEL